jgi:hypothetical protein
LSSLIAKIRNEYKSVVSSDDEIVENLTIANITALDFTPSHKLDEDEWFKLPGFSTKDYFINVCVSDYSTASLNQVENGNYNQISCIVIFQSGQKHFQRITPSRFVNQKRFLDFSGEPQIVEQRDQLEIKPESDAVYVVNEDNLYFKDVAKIKFFFPGIEVLHREATQDEVNQFLGNDFIALEGCEANSVGTLNRKRIADIGTKYQSLTDDKKTRLIDYAKEKAGIELNDVGAFNISSETDLKNLLYAMDQRYYYADIYEENRVANSIRVVSGGGINS